MAMICQLDDNGAMIRCWELGDEPTSIGRDESADVTVEDATLSRHHFLILREPGGYRVRDLNSQNGTFVDGQLAESVRLNHHDCIVAGQTVFLFSEKNVNLATAPARPALRATAVKALAATRAQATAGGEASAPPPQ